MQRPLGGVRAAAQTQGTALHGDPRMHLPRRAVVHIPACARQASRGGRGDQYVDPGRQGAGHRRRQTQSRGTVPQRGAATETHDDTRRQLVFAAGRRTQTRRGACTGGQPRTAGRRGQPGHAAAGAGLLRRSAAQCRGRSPERAGHGPAIPARCRAAAARPAGTGRGAVQARAEVSRRRNDRGQRGRADKATAGFASVRHAARSGG